MNTAAFADTPTTRCAYYRRTCGLPAGIHPEIGRIIIKAGLVGGITMPAALGQRVRDDLLHRRFTLGPIIAHVRSHRWTYLVRPDLPNDIRLAPALLHLNVSIVPFGSEIALPSPTDTPAHRQWVIPPRDTFRPSGLTIIAAVQARAPREPLH